MLIALIVGAFFGAALGQTLDSSISEKRILSILTALFAVLIIDVVRRLFGKAYPSVFLAPRDKTIPPAVWLGVGFSSVVGGLAGHDIGLQFGVTSGALFGLASGTIAGISMSMLMIVYFHEHPEEGVEY
jgi:uncharacterized membrane protein YfcA